MKNQYQTEKYDMNVDISIRYRLIVDTFLPFYKTIRYVLKIFNSCYITGTLVSIFLVKGT